MDKFISLLEVQIFGVCAWMGDKIGLRSSTIRMYFIYVSFFTFGSPVILYFVFSFLLEHKECVKMLWGSKRSSVWDL
jgi:phage shock protein PspC (stress-responsive transcriptional regulator)